MGPIADRTNEHLGSSDSALIRVRRLWLNAVAEGARGGTPIGVTTPDSYHVRATEFVIAAEADWTSAASDWVTGRPDAPAPLLT